MVRVSTGSGQGTGFVVSTDGLVLTANHVVEDADTATVQLPDNRELTASVMGRQLAADIAVLSSDGSDFAMLSLGNSDSLQIGDALIKIGYGAGLKGKSSVATGIVSAFREDDRFQLTYIQTDAPVNPGDSGGVLIDTTGEVVGIIVSKYVDVEVEGLSLAVAVNEIKSNISRLVDGETICQPFPKILDGYNFPNGTYNYSVTVPTNSYWGFGQLDSGLLGFWVWEQVVPGDRSWEYPSSGVYILVTLRDLPQFDDYLDSWIEALESIYGDVDVISTRPVCMPNVAGAQSWEVEASTVREVGHAANRERWLILFHGSVAYLLERLSWDSKWGTNEKYIDSLIYSFHFY